MDPSTRAAAARRFFFRQFVGFEAEVEDEMQALYAKAMLICATGDGTLHPAERDWVRGYFACTGAPDAVLDLIETYQGSPDDLAALMQSDVRLAKDGARNLIFDALRVCEADGALSEDELHRIRQVGTFMGLSAGDIRQVEAAYAVYKAAFVNKMATLFPGERPY